MGRTGLATQVYLDERLKARLQELADANGRTLTLEIIHALERHVASPPRLKTPKLADAPPPRPKRRPGRPRKPAPEGER